MSGYLNSAGQMMTVVDIVETPDSDLVFYAADTGDAMVDGFSPDDWCLRVVPAPTVNSVAARFSETPTYFDRGGRFRAAIPARVLA